MTTTMTAKDNNYDDEDDNDDDRVANCQFFYTEQNCWTKFYPKFVKLRVGDNFFSSNNVWEALLEM